ncbi:family 43 glycosylhydrolase [Natronospirillum operosum]|uniref:glycoside hydrolase family 43 protein n=1 Tax=Natronospirillum operosum TaxID=2759953 RepID=UPI001F11767D|nr:family 43 glycosylhydrolase [Natronospirillum operosum]
MTTNTTPAYANPVIPQRADPWVWRHSDGYYYFTGSVPTYDRIELRRARTIQGLGDAEPVTVWTRYPSGPLSANIWAPELHHIDGAWYIYFAAARTTETDNGLFDHRMYALECRDANPLTGQWVEKGQVDSGWESFCLDATSFEHRGTRYYVWAQKDPAIEGNSNLYIAPMANPWTLAGPAVMLSQPEYEWETIGFRVNEGAAVIVRHDRVFIAYSGSATDHHYCMGLLYADADADLLDPSAWTKKPQPVFESSSENGQYGPGHNSFTVSEDGQHDVLIYHARNYRDIDGDPLYDPNRHTRAQLIEWDADGFPVFGQPVPDWPVQSG